MIDHEKEFGFLRPGAAVMSVRGDGVSCLVFRHSDMNLYRTDEFGRMRELEPNVKYMALKTEIQEREQEIGNLKQKVIALEKENEGLKKALIKARMTTVEEEQDA